MRVSTSVKRAAVSRQRGSERRGANGASNSRSITARTHHFDQDNILLSARSRSRCSARRFENAELGMLEVVVAVAAGSMRRAQVEAVFGALEPSHARVLVMR